MATFSSSPLLLANLDSGLSLLERTCKIKMHRRTTATPLSITAASSNDNDYQNSSSKLVTFLGKGGSGKTTSAIFAAQHYAMSGLRTCLVIQTQDPSAEYLLNYKMGTSPTKCSDNLWAVRLETTKMLLEPLDRLKQADSRLKMTQGVLEGVVGEELGVLPAMDSIFAVYALAGLVGSLNVNQTNKDKFDIIVYDGVSTDETLRVIGAASKARLYLKYLRNLAEKTDFGRLAGPSLLRLVDESLSLSGSKYNLNGKMSAEIWDSLERMLMRGSSAFYEPSRFGCYLVMDPNIPTSVNSALRYWGCTLQAGAQVSGAVGISSPCFNEESLKGVKKNFLPLPFAFIPHLSISYPPEWNSVMLNTVSHEARTLFSMPASLSNSMTPPVKFDAGEKSVTLFMPGFDKSEIKLYQYRGGSELLVEAGDQRRVICLQQKFKVRWEVRSSLTEVLSSKCDSVTAKYYLSCILALVLVCPRLMC